MNFRRYIKDVIRLNRIGMIIIFLLTSFVSVLSMLQPKIIELVIDEGIQDKNIDVLVKLFIFYVSLMLVEYSLKYIIALYHTKVKKNYTYKLKLKLLKHISKLSGSYFSNQKTGELIKVVESDVYAIENAGVDLIMDIAFNCIISVCAIIILFRINYFLLFIVMAIEIVMIFFQKYMINKMYQKVKELRKISSESMSLTEEYISNIINFIIAKTENFFLKGFSYIEGENVKRTLEFKKCSETGKQVNNSINGVISIIIYLVSGIFIINGKMSIGTMVAFSQYTYYIVSPFLQIINSYTQIQNMMVSINKVYEVLDISIEDERNKLKIENNRYDINMCNVSFAYRKDEIILNDINMEFKPNSITAIVGSSGSGKSTISKLLYALWEVESGEIKIGGIPIKDINKGDLRRNIAIVTQDTILFDDSLKNNLILDKEIDINELNEICQKVQLSDVIKDLPNELNEIVGEKGNKLSGGQKQRIALARALLEKTPIIILDEATSALDNVTQKLVMDEITDILKNKTTIIITHRISTIQNADYIYVLKNHKIVECGKPDYLSEFGIEYPKLQLSEC